MPTFIAKMSQSERRLLFAVIGLVLIFIVFAVTLRCLDILETMDATIESQQIALMRFNEQAALVEPVERAFESMAAQHSSQWTQEEIHDRLRVEITRLSLRRVPDEGQPLPASNNPADMLVIIRAMPVGALEDSGEGYRSYQINFRTEPTSIQNIATFLQRLQQSSQALRVDSLELTRQPLSTEVTASLRVTRTVIGDATTAAPPVAATPEAPTEEAKNLARNPSFEQWDPQQSSFLDWTVTTATVSANNVDATLGTTAMFAGATGPDAEIYQVTPLKPGITYELQFDATTTGDARIQIKNEATGEPMQGAAALQQGAAHYKFLFTVPGDPGAPVPMRAPSIVLEKNGSTLVLDNVVLKEWREIK